MNDSTSKIYPDCMLYSKFPAYNKAMIKCVAESSRIDKSSKNFEDVIYEIKRMKTTNSIMKVLLSKNTVLVIPPFPMPKPFKVFVAKDFITDKIPKVFIDCTGIVTLTTDGYSINEDTLLSHLINAEISMIYSQLPKRIINESTVRTLSATCFAKLFTHIIDYIANISIIDYARDKCLYLSARYFLENVLKLDDLTSIRAIARKISSITEMKENTYDFIVTKNPKENPFIDLKKFVYLIADQFKIDKLSLDLVVEKWMYLYGQGTPFALEFFPALSAMMTDAYCGAYINNQKTIEKIAGKDMVEFAKYMIYNVGD